jgi:hypothetical protein
MFLSKACSFFVQGLKGREKIKIPSPLQYTAHANKKTVTIP